MPKQNEDAVQPPPEDDEPTTQQTPTGLTIPVPTREQVLDDFAKIAKAKPHPGAKKDGTERSS